MTFYIPYVGFGVIKAIDFIADITDKLVNALHKVNFTVSIDIPSTISVVTLMTIIILMTNFIIKNRQKMRIIIGSIVIVTLFVFLSINTDDDKISMLTGYEDALCW